MTTPPLLIENAHLYGPAADWDPGWLLADGGRIQQLGQGQPPELSAHPALRRIDARGLALLPGFIDLHVHGAAGHEAMDASRDGLHAMARFYARHGVTGFLPTTWSAAHPALLRALACIAAAVGPVPGGASILGAHVEGPYLNPARCGAQDTRLIRRANPGETLQLLDTGVIRLLALAPEFDENLDLLDECVRRGINVSAAHTDATYAQIQAAVGRGLRHATHTFNAMRPFGHREPGTAGAVMALPEVRCELIADTIHVHPAAIKILFDVKGPAGVILITDAIRAAGQPDGDYALDDRPVTVRDGAVRLPDGTLAGSVLTMDAALRNSLAATGRPLRELWRAASLNAAQAIGLSASKGSLEAGQDADLVLLDAQHNVCFTIVGGEIVYQAGQPAPP
ncbi:MAG: N-acetylglucosamine-6-phosphate deacetylase [Anaerolineales bacterium]